MWEDSSEDEVDPDEQYALMILDGEDSGGEVPFDPISDTESEANANEIQVNMENHDENEDENDSSSDIELGEDPQPTTVAEAVSEIPGLKAPDQHQKAAANTGDESSDENCPICFDPWTNSGDHRLVSLKCGHLFGKKCVERWLKSQSGKQKCPQCNAPAKRHDVRNIFARSLRALDVAEREKLKKDLKKEKAARKEVEQELNQANQTIWKLLDEKESLIKDLEACRKWAESGRPVVHLNKIAAANKESVMKNRAEPFKLLYDVELSLTGGCRLVATSQILNTIVVTMPSGSPMFPGFGIRKLSADFKPHEFLHLHQKAIKDITFHPSDEMLLSTSIDKTIKATGLLTGTKVATYNLDVEAWSVCFNTDNSNTFYAGLRNGSIVEYDLRITDRHVSEITSSNHTPVVSMQYVNKGYFQGVLATHLSSCKFQQILEGSESTFEEFDVPVEGNFLSSYYDKKSGYALLSVRPSSKSPVVTHNLLDLSVPSSGSFRTRAMKTFRGGKRAVQLARTKIYPHPSDASSYLVCAGDESVNGALIWEMNSSERPIQTLKLSPSKSVSSPTATDTAFDFSLISSQSRYVLGVLGDKKLSAYRWMA